MSWGFVKKHLVLLPQTRLQVSQLPVKNIYFCHYNYGWKLAQGPPKISSGLTLTNVANVENTVSNCGYWFSSLLASNSAIIPSHIWILKSGHKHVMWRYDTFCRNASTVRSLWQSWTHQWFGEMFTADFQTWQLRCSKLHNIEFYWPTQLLQPFVGCKFVGTPAA